MSMKLSTTENKNFLINLIRKDFDNKTSTYSKCLEIIKKTKALNLPSLNSFISELENDLKDAPLYT